MAPEETTITSAPRARSEAMSAAMPSSHAVRGAASSWSTTSALPIFTTTRWAEAMEGIMRISPLPRSGEGWGGVLPHLVAPPPHRSPALRERGTL